MAGPNGSGKSSAFQNTTIEAFSQSVWLINPDLLTERIRAVEKMSLAKANLAAVKRIESWLEASLRAHQTVGVETVLSTGKYRRLVTLARQLGFEIRLIYVILETPAHNVARGPDACAKGRAFRPEGQNHFPISPLACRDALVSRAGGLCVAVRQHRRRTAPDRTEIGRCRHA